MSWMTLDNDLKFKLCFKILQALCKQCKHVVLYTVHVFEVSPYYKMQYRAWCNVQHDTWHDMWHDS